MKKDKTTADAVAIAQLSLHSLLLSCRGFFPILPEPLITKELPKNH